MPKRDFNKVASNFIEITLRQGYSPVNLLHIFRTPFTNNSSERLLLYIAFNIFSCRTLIISDKMLIITGISNETTNELGKYAILCRNVNILPTKTSFFISSARKIKSM